MPHFYIAPPQLRIQQKFLLILLLPLIQPLWIPPPPLLPPRSPRLPPQPRLPPHPRPLPPQPPLPPHPRLLPPHPLRLPQPPLLPRPPRPMNSASFIFVLPHGLGSFSAKSYH
ncbi:hypothetical protein AB1E19_003616 [Capra hircus]